MGSAVEIQGPVSIHIVMKHLVDKRVLQSLISPHEAFGVPDRDHRVPLLVVSIGAFDRSIGPRAILNIGIFSRLWKYSRLYSMKRFCKSSIVMAIGGVLFIAILIRIPLITVVPVMIAVIAVKTTSTIVTMTCNIPFAGNIDCRDAT